jgi:amino acid adenylation domain-containing protein
VSYFGELVRTRGRRHGRRRAFLFLADGEREAVSLAYDRLAAEVERLSARLAGEAGRGERALLVYPPGLEFVVAFLACLDAGVVAVPVHPPSPRAGLGALPSFAADAEPRLVLGTGEQLARLRRAGGGDDPALAAARWHATALGAAGTAPPAAREPSPPADDDVAFLQYTSGSTGAPRGVMVSHANLHANEEAMRRAFAMDEASVVVSWLPPYHDMGLIGTLLQPLWCGGTAVLFSPLAFLQRPRRWLEAVTRYRATVTGGPDFGYALTERRVPPAERSGLDLSSLRVAFSGAEPVRAETLDRFAAAFAPCGFRREAFYPCYGLAEATLFVTGGAVDAAPVVREVPAAGAAGAAPRVGCGGAWAGEAVVVADPESGRPLPAGREGEIRVAGPSVARGYWRRPEESARVFGSPLSPGGPPFLRTGDLGVLGAAGELFVTGRLDDLMIVRGRNLHPADLEQAAEAAHPAVRPGGAAAFGVEADGEERVVVACEVERRREEDAGEAAARVRAALVEAHDVAAWDVLALGAGALPRTTSGKVRRGECRRRYEEGGWEPLAAARGGEGRAGEDLRGTEAGEGRDRRTAGDPPGRGTEAARPASGAAADGGFAALVARLAAEVTGMPAAGGDGMPDGATRSVADGGPGRLRLHLDSLQAVELAHRLEQTAGASPSLELLLSAPAVDAVAAALADAVRTSLSPTVPPPGAAADLVAARVGGEAPAPPAPGTEVPSTAPGTRHPPSEAQHAMWLRERLDPSGLPLALCCAARLRRADGGALEAGRVRRALLALTARHAALCVSFPLAGERPVAEVGKPRVDFAAVDAGGWSGGALREAVDAAAAAPFDLASGPLLRGRWWRDGPAKAGVLLLAVHHLVCDFASLEVLLAELVAELGAAPGAGPAAATPPPHDPFLTHIDARRRRLAGPRGGELEAWWRRELGGVPPVVELPADRPRPAVAGRRGGAEAVRLDAAAVAALRGAARRAGTTPFAWMLALWQAVLGRWAGAGEVPVAVAAADRPAGAQAAAGHFVNLLPVRSALAAGSAGELAARTGRRLAAALDHRDLPFPRIVELAAPPRDPSRHPLVQAGLVLEAPRRLGVSGAAALVLGEAAPPFRLGGLEVEPLALAPRTVELDLQLMVVETEAGLEASLQYAADLFDAATAARVAGWWRRGLEAAAADPGRRWQELPLLSAAESGQLRAAAGPFTAATPAPRDEPRVGGTAQPLPVHRAFAARAERAPRAPAVLWRPVGGGVESVDYGQLAERVEALARCLAAAGVGFETPVGVLVGRTPARLVALLAVLTAGGCTVALEPSDPPRRLAALLAAGGARVLVAGGAVPAGYDGRILSLAADGTMAVGDRVLAAAAPPPAAAGDPEAAAYVVFTSGSTGDPKGVVVPHRAIAALAASAARDLGLGPRSRMLHQTALSFDVALGELLAPPACGAAVAMAGEDARRSGRELAAAVDRFEATHLLTTPAVLALLDAGGVPSLATVCSGGEVTPPALARRWAPRLRLVNAYGPAESTVYSTLSPCADGDAEAIRRLGRPIAGTRMELVDRHGAPALPGALGEIVLAGRGLARGYLGDPAATAARFVPDPWTEKAGARRYRTGDLARRLPAGGAAFAGRADRQLKVRGVRLEPAEVEAALTVHPAVAAAAVDRRGELLAAWLVGRPGRPVPPPEELRRFLAERLPATLVPSRFAVVEALPRTAHGKLDREALELPPAAGGAEPRGELERTIARLWAEELGVERVPADVSFFDLGGHSLALARLHGRLCRALGREIPLPDLFSHATVAALAAHLEGGGEDRGAAGGARGTARRDAMDERLRRRREAAAAAGGLR